MRTYTFQRSFSVFLYVLLIFLPCFSVGIPAGFTTFFSTPSCPQGWTEITSAQGRLILSVVDGSTGGVTLGDPLGPQEDRNHLHPYSGSLNLPQKEIAADNCCNNQGAAQGTYSINSNVANHTSGLPFVQLLACTLQVSNSDPIASGTVAYFDHTVVTQCPVSFEPYEQAAGRFIVPSFTLEGVIVSDTNPIASGEDVLHNHGITVSVGTTDVSYVGASGCCNSDTASSGEISTSITTSSVSTGLPYIQLLTCTSQQRTFDATLPPGGLLFSQIGCPNGWNITILVSGRFVVANPKGGTPGATFGADSLPPGDTGNPTHEHDFSGSVNFPSTGVGLASGCCAGGYAGAGGYSYQGTTSSSAADFPYVMIPLCAQNPGLSKLIHF